MEFKDKLTSRLTRLGKKARRIFNIGYEDLSAQIYYDNKESFRLMIVKSDQSLLLDKEISRAQAFRIMNTR